MRFLELPIPPCPDLGEEILKVFSQKKQPLKKEELFALVRSHQVYFQNQPVGFLPFKIFKKGKVQIYLEDLKGWEISKSDILFEDKWLIAVNKPSGLASQSSLRFLQDHAYGAVLCLLRNRKPFKSPPLFLLHRLDMDTSGVLLMSKKSSINKGLQNLFEKKQIQKTYLALSKTASPSTPPSLVKSYLERQPDSIHKFKFGSTTLDKNPKAKLSETHIELISQKSDLKLFKVQPKTGRSHQIRVHLKESEHPILGDPFYEGEKASHLFLHAQSLEFIHPMTKEPLKITAPLPTHWSPYQNMLKS